MSPTPMISIVLILIGLVVVTSRDSTAERGDGE